MPPPRPQRASRHEGAVHTELGEQVVSCVLEGVSDDGGPYRVVRTFAFWVDQEVKRSLWPGSLEAQAQGDATQSTSRVEAGVVVGGVANSFAFGGILLVVEGE